MASRRLVVEHGDEPDVIAAVVDAEPFDQVRVVSGGELEGGGGFV